MHCHLKSVMLHHVVSHSRANMTTQSSSASPWLLEDLCTWNTVRWQHSDRCCSPQFTSLYMSAPLLLTTTNKMATDRWQHNDYWYSPLLLAAYWHNCTTCMHRSRIQHIVLPLLFLPSPPSSSYPSPPCPAKHTLAVHSRHNHSLSLIHI